MPKAKIRGSKEHSGRSHGKSNGESAKGTMLSEMRSSGYELTILHVLVVVLLYISVGMSEKSECTLRGQSVLNLQSAKENIVSVFHSVIATKLDRPQMKANEELQWLFYNGMAP